jgi:hypothetical protein
MKIVAITTIGTEYAYITSSAHGVPQKLARKVCDELNRVRYNGTRQPLSEGMKWHVYDIDAEGWNNGASFAAWQRFGIRRGALCELKRH